MKNVILAFLLLGFTLPAHAQLAIKDGNGSVQTLGGTTVGGNFIPGHAGAAGTLTQTTVTLAANTSTAVIAANISRRYLLIQVRSGGTATIAPGTGTVTAGVGVNVDPSASSAAGGTVSFDGTFMPTNAFSAIATSATVLTVWEGQ